MQGFFPLYGQSVMTKPNTAGQPWPSSFILGILLRTVTQYKNRIFRFSSAFSGNASWLEFKGKAVWDTNQIRWTLFWTRAAADESCIVYCQKSLEPRPPKMFEKNCPSSTIAGKNTDLRRERRVSVLNRKVFFPQHFLPWPPWCPPWPSWE